MTDTVFIISATVDSVWRNKSLEDIDPSNIPEGATAVEVPSGTIWGGETYANGEFTAPDIEEPPIELPPIDAWRFEAAIALAGIKDAIDAAIDALPEPDRTIAKAKRARVQQYHRNDPLIAALAPALNLTDDDIDALWLSAMGL